jgi:type 1 glutamine amidotransferase
MKTALIVQGGWDGHKPKEVAGIFERVLREEGFSVTVSDTLEAFRDGEALKRLSLIVPVWTMGKLEGALTNNVTAAVAEGVGMAGCHGGMCDSFRENTDWLFMTGGQFVAHPGNDGTKFTVHMGPSAHPITEGIKDFDVASEQYYMLTDPSNNVLAWTKFPNAPGNYAVNAECRMPTIWTRMWGKGRVFYSSLGHSPDVVEGEPHLTIMRRGFRWAAR